jgi:hypothetical protein
MNGGEPSKSRIIAKPIALMTKIATSVAKVLRGTDVAVKIAPKTSKKPGVESAMSFPLVG